MKYHLYGILTPCKNIPIGPASTTLQTTASSWSIVRVWEYNTECHEISFIRNCDSLKRYTQKDQRVPLRRQLPCHRVLLGCENTTQNVMKYHSYGILTPYKNKPKGHHFADNGLVIGYYQGVRIQYTMSWNDIFRKFWLPTTIKLKKRRVLLCGSRHRVSLGCDNMIHNVME